MQASTDPEIAVIVVNYGTAALAADAVESVLSRDHGGRRVEVHLLDNASPGDDARTLSDLAEARGWGPRVTLHLESVNHGFGRGNNLVLTRLAARSNPPEKVFLLNPDARLENEALAVLAEVLDACPDIAIVGSSLVRPDGGAAVTSAFRYPNLADEFASAFQIGLATRLLDRWRVPLPPETPMQTVDWVSGAAFMARFQALKDCGFFRPQYFLYFEEVDLMRRLTRLGWKILTVPQAQVSHVAGAATGQRAGRTVAAGRAPRPAYWYESWRIYFTANHSRGYALICALAKLSGWGGNYVLRRLQGRTPDSPKGFARDMVRHVLRPILWPWGRLDGGFGQHT